MTRSAVALCVFPLKKELKLFRQALIEKGFNYDQNPIGKLCGFRFVDLNLLLVHGGHGKTQFALQTQYVVNRVGDVEFICCSGAAGALSPELAAGDVVLADKTIEHDYIERFTKQSLPEFEADDQLLKSFEQAYLPIAENFRLRKAIIASGDEDIVDPARGAQVRSETGADAVAWEGAGGARAAVFNKIPFIEIRGITDSANASSSSDFAQNLKRAMDNIASLFVSKNTA